MSGHSKWSQIKHQKGVVDQKRGRLFSKLLKAITITARIESNPQFNPRLRAAIDKARENQVPADNIERAIKRSTEVTLNIEELILEAYGPGGIAILIQAATDNKNRAVAEIKKIFLFWKSQTDKTGRPIQQIETILICGDEGHRSGLAEYIEGEVKKPAHIGDVWINVFSFHDYVPGIPLEESLGYAGAIGLALSHNTTEKK